MVKVITEIEIDAAIDVCFDLARNIDVHTQTVWRHTKERAVAGTTTGMINEGETVTFQATHFLIRQKLRSKITAYNRPFLFVDEMMYGAFKSLRHEHNFIDLGNKNVDERYVSFEAPLGLLGWLAERLVLQHYMKRFLMHRNVNLKRLAEKSSGPK